MNIWTIMFGVALLFAAIIVRHFGTDRLREASTVVTMVWLLNLLYVTQTDDFASWRVMAVIDFVAAYVILSPPCNLARQFIGVLYIAQIVFHGVFASYELRGLEEPRDAYLTGLYVLGACQIVALLIGVYNDRSKKRDGSCVVHRRNSVSFASSHSRNGIEK